MMSRAAGYGNPYKHTTFIPRWNDVETVLFIIITDLFIVDNLKWLLQKNKLIKVSYVRHQQARNQKFFRAGNVSWNLGTSISNSSKT